MDAGCDHCSSTPVQSKKLMTFLREFAGGCQFTPEKSERFHGHFKTWEEMASLSTIGKLQPQTLDEGLEGDMICKNGCRKVFQSAADRERHNRLVHKI